MNNSYSLEAKTLFKLYGNKWVVKDVDLKLNKGEIVGLLGPNGAGKTTTFYMITGMIKPTKGHIILDEKDITRDPMYKRSRKGIGQLSQEPSIFGKLSVEDNIMLVLVMIDPSKYKREEKLDQLFEEFSINHIRSKFI